MWPHSSRGDIAKPLEDLSSDLKVETVLGKIGPKSHRSDRAFIAVCWNDPPQNAASRLRLAAHPRGVDVRQVSQKEMDFTPRYGSHIHLSAVPPVIVRVHHIVIVWWCVAAFRCRRFLLLAGGRGGGTYLDVNFSTLTSCVTRINNRRISVFPMCLRGC